MCLALPGRITAIRGMEADVVVGNFRPAAAGETSDEASARVGAREGAELTSADGQDIARKAGLQLCPEARVGDFVLVKTGLVVEVLSEADARELMTFLTEMVALLEDEGEPVDTTTPVE